jgi:protein-disulfide isomerase
MEQKKGLTLNGMSGVNFLFILNALAMIIVSIYLTNHFYDTLYPTRISEGGTICNISSFFNCDAATYSQMSNVAGVPISFFGIVIGLLFIFSALIPSAAMEKTSSAISKYNLIGCLILFVFSLAVLGSLCPFCTLYYVLSAVAALLFWKFGENSWTPNLKIAGLWGVLLLGGSAFMYSTTKGKADVQGKLAASVVSQYRNLPSLGDPDVESAYKIHMATKTFAESPIRISVFSDFECPFCKVVAEQLPELARRYPDKVSIQYFFFPLDSKCNSQVKTGMHRNACDAAILAACDPSKFLEIHDEIFERQRELENGALTDIASKHGLTACKDKEDIKNTVIGLINHGSKFNLKSTPTIILNGKKIEGTIANSQFFAIFDDILAGQK